MTTLVFIIALEKKKKNQTVQHRKKEKTKTESVKVFHLQTNDSF